MVPPVVPQLMTLRDVRIYLGGVSRTRLDRMRKNGFPRPVSLVPGGNLLWRRSEIDAYLAALEPVG